MMNEEKRQGKKEKPNQEIPPSKPQRYACITSCWISSKSRFCRAGQVIDFDPGKDAMKYFVPVRDES